MSNRETSSAKKPPSDDNRLMASSKTRYADIVCQKRSISTFVISTPVKTAANDKQSSRYLCALMNEAVPLEKKVEKKSAKKKAGDSSVNRRIVQGARKPATKSISETPTRKVEKDEKKSSIPSFLDILLMPSNPKLLILFPQRCFNVKHGIFSGEIVEEHCEISSHLWGLKHCDDPIMTHIPTDHWIIGIRYGKKGKGLDAQIGCSGSLWSNETVMTTVTREMSEELGIFPKITAKTTLWSGLNFRQKGDPISHYVCSFKIDDVEPVVETTNQKSGKNTHHKVFALVHGTKSEIIALLKALKTVHQSDDYPWSVIALPKAVMVNAVKFFRSNPDVRRLNPLSIL